jgi:hypothetical protein
MYFNTTTIPTEYIDNKPGILSGLCYGLFFIVTFVGGFFQQIYINYEKDARETCSSSSSSGSASASGSDTDEEIDESITGFSNLLDRELSEEDLQQLQFKIVRETTASGEIVMTYHKDTETFWYYADHLKDVHYSMLETVARKFVIANDCKRIYTQTPLEEEVEHKAVEPTTLEPMVVEHKVVEPEQTKNVFAKFKKYNSGGKGANPNFKATLKVIEQTNHFRYKGKLKDYADLLKEREEKEKAKASPILDYAAYRDLLTAKKEN